MITLLKGCNDVIIAQKKTNQAIIQELLSHFVYQLPNESKTLVVCLGIILLFIDSLLRRHTNKRAAILLKWENN
jgi:hypothetical protein